MTDRLFRMLVVFVVGALAGIGLSTIGAPTWTFAILAIVEIAAIVGIVRVTRVNDSNESGETR